MSKRKTRHALELIDWLQPLRLAYPEFDGILAGAIEDLQHEAKRNPEADRQLVLSAIHLGSWTIGDLLLELPMKRKPLQTILDHLVVKEVVIKSVQDSRDDLGGRPTILYLPAPSSLRK
ncbi:MAG: hypothetical protein ABJB61_13095 [bacterium]